MKMFALLSLLLVTPAVASPQNIYPRGKIPQGMECSQHEFRDENTGQIGPMCSWPEINEQKKNTPRQGIIGVLKI